MADHAHPEEGQRQLRLQVLLSPATAPHVVPGAYFGVMSDPEKPWVVPQCVLSLQGAQLPL
ncbi:hypothetical protein LZ198_03890 [Myxococcus sp. K15C18031901]|uniref:hypothetical protein n=1 Tax=Myxococcus dinghuensis TaxID=2906761 RepID=UPI0020A74302|nr:hypothetical protein [Myxococcus dinghuensis]MCP3098015.1 hypothetical protein [Myxococcus dinghuensis]